MLSFIPIIHYETGTVASLLFRSYAELAMDQYWKKEKQNWLQFDHEVFENPDTVGKCTFATLLEDKIIGFGSYDPRQRPEFGIIGHNCILPGFRGNGYGTQQVFEILKRFRAMGIKKAVVSTCEHPFFLPAQRMYLSCGFEESRRYVGGPDPRYKLIKYERYLSKSG